MGIHAIDRTAIDDLATDVYATALACGPLPRRRLVEAGVPPAVAYALVRDELILDGVRMRGWQIASYPLPANRRHTVVQRVLVRHGVSRDMVTLLAADLRRAVQHLTAHPVPRSDEHRAGHHH